LQAHALSTRSRVLGASRSPTDDVHEAWVCDVGRLHLLSGGSRRTSGERPGGHHDGECVGGVQGAKPRLLVRSKLAKDPLH
jgi:hypothetical protein